MLLQEYYNDVKQLFEKIGIASIKDNDILHFNKFKLEDLELEKVIEFSNDYDINSDMLNIIKKYFSEVTTRFYRTQYVTQANDELLNKELKIFYKSVLPFFIYNSNFFTNFTLKDNKIYFSGQLVDFDYLVKFIENIFSYVIKLIIKFADIPLLTSVSDNLNNIFYDWLIQTKIYFKSLLFTTDNNSTTDIDFNDFAPSLVHGNPKELINAAYNLLSNISEDRLKFVNDINNLLKKYSNIFDNSTVKIYGKYSYDFRNAVFSEVENCVNCFYKYLKLDKLDKYKNKLQYFDLEFGDPKVSDEFKKLLEKIKTDKLNKDYVNALFNDNCTLFNRLDYVSHDYIYKIKKIIQSISENKSKQSNKYSAYFLYLFLAKLEKNVSIKNILEINSYSANIDKDYAYLKEIFNIGFNKYFIEFCLSDKYFIDPKRINYYLAIINNIEYVTYLDQSFNFKNKISFKIIDEILSYYEQNKISSLTINDYKIISLLPTKKYIISNARYNNKAINYTNNYKGISEYLYKNCNSINTLPIAVMLAFLNSDYYITNMDFGDINYLDFIYFITGNLLGKDALLNDYEFNSLTNLESRSTSLGHFLGYRSAAADPRIKNDYIGSFLSKNIYNNDLRLFLNLCSISFITNMYKFENKNVDFTETVKNNFNKYKYIVEYDKVVASVYFSAIVAEAKKFVPEIVDDIPLDCMQFLPVLNFGKFTLSTINNYALKYDLRSYSSYSKYSLSTSPTRFIVLNYLSDIHTILFSLIENIQYISELFDALKDPERYSTYLECMNNTETLSSYVSPSIYTSTFLPELSEIIKDIFKNGKYTMLINYNFYDIEHLFKKNYTTFKENDICLLKFINNELNESFEPVKFIVDMHESFNKIK